MIVIELSVTMLATNSPQHLTPSSTRTPILNLNKEIVDKIAQKLGFHFTAEKEETDGIFAPIDILDYKYAVLHSPAYREKYKEFLKIEFPRVPYPEDRGGAGGDGWVDEGGG